MTLTEQRRCSTVSARISSSRSENPGLARGLHPAILADRGLVPALQSLANRAPFLVEITTEAPERLPEAIEAAVYYVVAESLTNAAKHAGASEAWVELSTTTDAVVVEIRDNGSGGADLGKGTGCEGSPTVSRPSEGRSSCRAARSAEPPFAPSFRAAEEDLRTSSILRAWAAYQWMP